MLVKVVDFGIAKLRESGAHTQTGMVLGTPAYMSFEQASGMRSDELDARSDVYSLGVVVYEMLTGRTPFHSDTPVGYLRMHMQEDPPPFRAVKPDLPALPQLESVVMKALTKDRDQRYASVLDFARDFMQPPQPSTRTGPPTLSPSTGLCRPSASVNEDRCARGDAGTRCAHVAVPHKTRRPRPILPSTLRSLLQRKELWNLRIRHRSGANPRQQRVVPPQCPNLPGCGRFRSRPAR